jgi:RNA polymerase sigma factor for flagellar operon FliA
MTNSPGATSESRVLTAIPPPNAQELWQRYHHQGDADVENELVIKYLPLVSATLARLSMTLPDHVDRDDLNSVGLIGLLQSLRNFDPSCGTSFETYARLRIRGAMLDELRRMDWMPRTIHEKARKLQNTMAQLEQKYSKPPTDAQMLDDVRPATFICLDSVHSTEEGDGGSLHEVVSNAAAADPMDRTSQQELKRVIFDRLKQLPDIQRKVLALYYLEDMNLREIAEAFNLTESRICQIHAQAVVAIRSYVERIEAGLAKLPVSASQP